MEEASDDTEVNYMLCACVFRTQQLVASSFSAGRARLFAMRGSTTAPPFSKPPPHLGPLLGGHATLYTVMQRETSETCQGLGHGYR